MAFFVIRNGEMESVPLWGRARDRILFDFERDDGLRERLRNCMARELVHLGPRQRRQQLVIERAPAIDDSMRLRPIGRAAVCRWEALRGR